MELLRRYSLIAFSLFLCHWRVQVSYLLIHYWWLTYSMKYSLHQDIKMRSIRLCMVCPYNYKLSTLIVLQSLSFFFMFIYLKERGERERELHLCKGGAERERGERERTPSRLHTVNVDSDMGLEFTNCEIMTWAKIMS